VLGTAAYLAPEQARGEEAGPRADIYSLGVVAYQLLSGRLPYEAASLSELALKQQRESPMPLEEINPLVPRELAVAITLALSIEAAARPQDALVFAESLRQGAHGIRPVGAAAGSTPGTAATRIVSPREAATSATRVAAGGLDTAATTARPGPARRLEPRPYPTGGQPRVPRERAADRRRPGRGARRFVALLALLCVIIAAVVVAVAISTGTSHGVKTFSNDVIKTFQDAYNHVQNLINGNTK